MVGKDTLLAQLSRVISREEELIEEKKKFTELWANMSRAPPLTPRKFTSPSIPLPPGRGVLALMDPKGKDVLLKVMHEGTSQSDPESDPESEPESDNPQR
jgi:hypothetical protein